MFPQTWHLFVALLSFACEATAVHAQPQGKPAPLSACLWEEVASSSSFHQRVGQPAADA